MGNSVAPASEQNPPKALKEDGQEEYEQAIKELNDGNIQNAIDLLTKSIQFDYSKAKLQLGIMYRDGRGVIKNTNLAIETFKSGQHEDGFWECQVGLMHLKGLGVEKDILKAQDYFQRAIEKDNIEAQAHLGFLGITGTDHDTTKGIHLLNEIAEKSAEANCYLGLIHMEGMGVPRNYITAMGYLNKAVDMGQLDANIYLAELYLQGKGTDRKPWTAAKLLLRAAEKGHPRAQCYIGIMHRDGLGVVNNQQMAQKYLKISAIQGDTLGMYSWGKYMLEDTTKAYEWVEVVELLAKAAEKGNTEGEILDDLYMDGLARVFRLDVN